MFSDQDRKIEIYLNVRPVLLLFVAVTSTGWASQSPNPPHLPSSKGVRWGSHHQGGLLGTGLNRIVPKMSSKPNCSILITSLNFLEGLLCNIFVGRSGSWISKLFHRSQGMKD